MIRKETVTWILILLSLLFNLTGTSQAPFSRGVNLTGWFQVNSPGKIQLLTGVRIFRSIL